MEIFLYNILMKIIITSGGTSEAIDRVRAITNHSSGRLGKQLVETFLEKGAEVTLVTTKHALKPAPHSRLTILEISNVQSLMETLEPLVQTHDAIVHAMAVSDYTPVYMTDLDEVRAAADLRLLLDKKNTETKISSQAETQVLFLQKTPKVISHIKQWNPDIRLIGFKLLVDVSKEELITVARHSLSRNQADYILANDLTDINENGHRAYLVGADSIDQLETKQEIAALIYKKIAERN